jgi:hypothetical protein
LIPFDWPPAFLIGYLARAMHHAAPFLPLRCAESQWPLTRNIRIGIFASNTSYAFAWVSSVKLTGRCFRSFGIDGHQFAMFMRKWLHFMRRDEFLPPSIRRFSGLRCALKFYVQRYLFSIESLFALGLFNSAVVALVSHKIMMIWLHRPLPAWGLLLTGPCLFVFDLITLMMLHWGLTSTKAAYKSVSGIIAVMIMLCSATFASLYIEGNAELNWERSVEVIFHYRANHRS